MGQYQSCTHSTGATSSSSKIKIKIKSTGSEKLVSGRLSSGRVDEGHPCRVTPKRAHPIELFRSNSLPEVESVE